MPPVRLKAGEVLFIPDGKIRSANVGDGKAVELATYIVRKGEPLLKLENEKPKPNKPKS